MNSKNQVSSDWRLIGLISLALIALASFVFFRTKMKLMEYVQ